MDEILRVQLLHTKGVLEYAYDKLSQYQNSHRELDFPSILAESRVPFPWEDDDLIKGLVCRSLIDRVIALNNRIAELQTELALSKARKEIAS